MRVKMFLAAREFSPYYEALVISDEKIGGPNEG